jgi:hypothetical protein
MVVPSWSTTEKESVDVFTGLENVAPIVVFNGTLEEPDSGHCPVATSAELSAVVYTVST